MPANAHKFPLLGIFYSKEKDFTHVLFRDSVAYVLADISTFKIDPKIQHLPKIEKIRFRIVKIPKPKCWLAAYSQLLAGRRNFDF